MVRRVGWSQRGAVCGGVLTAFSRARALCVSVVPEVQEAARGRWSWDYGADAVVGRSECSGSCRCWWRVGFERIPQAALDLPHRVASIALRENAREIA